MLQGSKTDSTLESTNIIYSLPLNLHCTTPSSSIQFQFTYHSPSSQTSFFSNEIEKQYPDVMFHLSKWGFDSNHMSVHRFSFDQPLPDYLHSTFLQQFLTDSVVLQQFKVISSTTDAWTSLGQVDPDSILADRLSTTFSDLSIFNDLFEKGILHENGFIRPCLDFQVSCLSECLGNIEPLHEDPTQPSLSLTTSCDFLVSDELRRSLVDSTFEHYSLFSSFIRKEVLFHILAHLVIGGRINQFEDTIGPYFDAVKAFSRTFLRVSKNKDDEILIRSLVFRIIDLKSSMAPLFPFQHLQNFLIVFVDPIGRKVTTFYHASPNYYL